MEKLREWTDKRNRADWSSRARCVMGREGWREERAWLGRAFWGEQRSPQGEGCRWLLMPGGGRREVRGRGRMWLEWLLQARQGEVACSE